MTRQVSRPTTPSAAMHVERIRAGEQERAARQDAPAAKSTAGLYADRILPGYAADEALREEARKSELRARGIWTPGAEQLVEELDEVEDVEEFEDEEPEEAAPLTTAERYAVRETERRAAEHEANLVAQKSAGRTAPEPVGHRYAAQLAQPHRYADRWGPKPTA